VVAVRVAIIMLRALPAPSRESKWGVNRQQELESGKEPASTCWGSHRLAGMAAADLPLAPLAGRHLLAGQHAICHGRLVAGGLGLPHQRWPQPRWGGAGVGGQPQAFHL
jgi:hypothetical protein